MEESLSEKKKRIILTNRERINCFLAFLELDDQFETEIKNLKFEISYLEWQAKEKAK